MGSVQHIGQRMRELYHGGMPAHPTEGPGSLTRSLSFHLQLLFKVGVRMNEERALAQASSLAYKTILSIVPTVAVALSLLKAFGGFSGPDSPVVRFVAALLMPADEVDVLAEKIVELTSHISFGAIGGISLSFLVLVAVSLLDTIDETFNVIWRVPRQRGVFFRFTTFYTLLTLGPLLLSVSLLQTARLQGLFLENPISKTLSYSTPLLFTWIALVLSYKLFPNVRVHWKPAALGALLAALGIEVLKFAFNLYLSESMSRSYTTIYGALALIPLFLVWIYTVWAIVLFGATYCYMLQNLPQLQERERLARTKGREAPKRLPVGEHLACRILTQVARAFASGGTLPSRQELISRLDVDEAAVDVVVERLLERGWLRRVRDCADSEEPEALVPGRGLRRVLLPEVVAAFRAASSDAGRGSASDPLELWLEELDRLVAAALPPTTLADLAGVDPLPETPAPVSVDQAPPSISS